jgi:hypothetical protein
MERYRNVQIILYGKTYCINSTIEIGKRNMQSIEKILYFRYLNRIASKLIINSFSDKFNIKAWSRNSIKLVYCKNGGV